MKLKLFNTETKSYRDVFPYQGDTIRMYTCGPTIYNFAHIGNLRTYVAEDLLRRTIQFFGFKVEQAMNLTDIDDKTLRGALAEKISLKAFTDPFKVAFFEDLEKLQIEKAEHYPAATAYIGRMIEMIQMLLQKGLAYTSPQGNVYFAIHKFPKYGRLSHLAMDQLKINASGDNIADEYEKEDVSDFVLWKAYEPERDGDIFWDSPFGKGRPGWHIECSAMATKLLGETIDIHCGGVDNLFPHHENEIAQSEGCFGKQFVHHWFHVEHLLVEHKKMSKRLNNFYTLRDLLEKGYTGNEVRYLLLSTHYRIQLNFTLQSLDAARASLLRLQTFIQRLQKIQEPAERSAHVFDLIQRAELEFKKGLADDLNVAVSLAVLFDFLRDINALCDSGAIGQTEAEAILTLLSQWNRVLGFLPFENQEEIPQNLLVLLNQREQARKDKNYQLSDQLRNEILSSGYVIEDTQHGARLKRTYDKKIQNP